MEGTGAGREPNIETFQYPSGPDQPLRHWELWGISVPEDEGIDSAEDEDAEAGDSALQPTPAEFERLLEQERQKAFEAGRDRGRQEGRETERAASAANIGACTQKYAQQAAGLIETFAQEREHYLHAVEHDVVRLALAVAARILRREAQMDPLLLLGAVRVALGQLSASTKVRLRVPASDLGLWSEAIGLLPKNAVKPEIVAGEGMRLGDCVIETEMGSVDLGARAQLSEIERGFFDRADSSAAESAPAKEKQS